MRHKFENNSFIGISFAPVERNYTSRLILFQQFISLAGFREIMVALWFKNLDEVQQRPNTIALVLLYP